MKCSRSISAGFLLACLLTVASGPEAFAQKKNKKDKNAPPVTAPAAPAAGALGAKPESTGPKSYKSIITDKAVTDSGLFVVHRIEDKFFYEIPDSLLNRDLLMVTRIAKTATNIGYGGEELNTQVLNWERMGNRIFLRVKSYQNVAADSLPVYHSVKNSNFEPILAAFDIKAYGKDSSSVIEVTELFNKDVPAIGLDNRRRTQYKVRRLDDKRSYIASIKSFPTNIEARAVLTYDAAEPPSNSATGAISLELNHSMLLLPKVPMKPRLADNRVGFFSLTQTDYGSEEQRAARKRYIVRWRLEPKDPEAYARGELVEPKKQIVYYIDPATPIKWRPYLKQGVDDWNKAFEAAGFKNAIVAKDPPTPEQDPEFSTEDARYSVIRYFSSDIQNAYGPNVHDPRSGEILESHIGWYHNVMSLIRNWYFVQTAAINPDARTMHMKDEVMGKLIQFVSSHEVGHTLGLAHNMGSSSAYPVDSLRSATFTQQFGTAPSIMDYARFNYIAQPGDKGVALMPQIGIYDKHAIRWGYSWLPGRTPQDETKTLNAWLRAHENDARYRYGRQMGTPRDPSSQTEDLGDDAMKASAYGIANLKRIMPNLIKWTAEDGKNYNDLQEMHTQVLGQWNRYMGHVTANIGGVYENFKTYDQKGNVYSYVPKSKQQKAMAFLQDQAFATPTWMLDKNILLKTEASGAVERLRAAQMNVLNNLLEPGRMSRLIEAEATEGTKTYTLPNMLAELRGGIWKEVATSQKPDLYRRNLQRGYLERMEYLMTQETPAVPAALAASTGATRVNVAQSDIRPLVRGELTALQRSIRTSLAKTTDTITKYHLQDALVRIDRILNPKS